MYNKGSGTGFYRGPVAVFAYVCARNFDELRFKKLRKGRGGKKKKKEEEERRSKRKAKQGLGECQDLPEVGRRERLETGGKDKKVGKRSFQLSLL